ncbi:MAG: hypothetical protein V2I33_22980, partial [Kangiellaceae bacterium]|nr:hypothetical protein [Kangiellaceae bacterium]
APPRTAGVGTSPKKSLTPTRASNRPRFSVAASDYSITSIDRAELEELFLQCVDEQRKVVVTRRLNSPGAGRRLLRSPTDLLQPDKRQILERFVQSDQAAEAMAEILFTQPT